MSPRRTIACVVFTIGIFSTGFAQSDSTRNLLKIGTIGEGSGPFTMAAAFERSIGTRLGIQGSLGVNPVYGNGPGFWPLVLHLSVEARYYFALRRDRLMSGFHVGPYLHHERLALYYNSSSVPYARSYWSGIGLALGYQHAFGDQFRIGTSLVYSYGPKFISEGFTKERRLLFRNVWLHNRAVYLSVFIGLTL